MESLKGKSTHCLYLNLDKISDEEFLSLYPNVQPHPFIPHAYYFDEEEYPLGKSLLFDIGAFYILDASSLLPPLSLGVTPGMRVLDLCAAPGGKSFVLSTQLGPSGILLSNDLSYPRAKELSGNMERLGRGNVIVTSGDMEKAKEHYLEAFDAILLDAPCSGSSMFRKSKEAENDWTIEKVLRCASIQASLLELASSLLSPGGKLVYSTCSFSYEEDEGVLLSFLKEHPEFSPLPVEDHPGYFHHPDLPVSVRLFPHRYIGEGQFFCLLQKAGNAVTKVSKPSRNAKSPFIEAYGLEERDNLLLSDGLFSLGKRFDVQGLSLLRYGVKISSKEDPLKPDFALARFLSASSCLPLSKEQTLSYLHGDTFAYEGKDGFYPVSYQGLSLGFVKLVHGQAKNHYPKGLRRDYRVRK